MATYTKGARSLKTNSLQTFESKDAFDQHMKLHKDKFTAEEIPSNSKPEEVKEAKALPATK